MSKDSFYTAYGNWADKLTEGASLKLDHHIEYDKFRRDVPELMAIVTLSVPELKQRRKASAKLEQDIFKRAQGVIKEWEEQAAQTLLFDKALEYAHTPQVEHTSNKWVQRKDGSWEISNLVYKMCYHIWEDTGGDKKGTWLVSWALGVNRPERPPTEKYNFNGDPIIAEQKKKRYDTFDAAQRYIQGRFDQYVGLFRELRPPVPYDHRSHFYINGCLLPDYTVAAPEKAEPDLEAVDALLDYLVDGDGDETPPPDPTPEPADPLPAPEPAAKSTPAPQKSSAPPVRTPKRPTPKTKPKRKNTMAR